MPRASHQQRAGAGLQQGCEAAATFAIGLVRASGSWLPGAVLLVYSSCILPEVSQSGTAAQPNTQGTLPASAMDAQVALSARGPGFAESKDGGGTSIPRSDASSATDAGGHTSSSTGGGAAPTIVSTAEPGGVCSERGRLACRDHASKETLECDGARWKLGPKCSNEMRCSTSDDSTLGKCTAIPMLCSDLKPGDRTCSGQNVVVCGIDLLTVDPADTCDGVNAICINGQCSCPLKCNGTCVDPQTDASNCGVCNRPCDRCVDGQCEATTLTSDLDLTFNLRVHSSGIYINQRSQDLFKIPIDGGPAKIFLKTTMDYSIDNEYVYFVDNDSSLNRIGHSNNQAQKLSNNFMSFPVPHGKFVYFIDQPTSGVNSDYRILRVSIDGGSPATLATIARPAFPTELAVDETHVYWLNQTNADDNADSIHRTTLSGGVVTPLATGLNSPHDLVIAGRTLFWIELDMNIRSLSLDGGNVVHLLEPARVSDIFFDGTTLYWCGRGYLGQLDASLAPTEQRRVGEARVIGADAAFIYWGEESTILRVPKSIAQQK